jgi:hypothetical protein
VSLVGLRRPFSPQAERLSEETMKKKAKASAEPMGIVIAPGQSSENTPRVRAYFWFEVPTTSEEEQ